MANPRAAASAGVLAAQLPDTSNKAWRDDTSSFAQRMLKKMGWSAGKGLGKREDGVVEHVRVKRRVDAAGVGAAPRAADGVSGGRNGNEVLLGAVSEYNALLASLASKGRNPAAAEAISVAAAADKDGAAEGVPEGEDEDEETRKARRRQERKKKRRRERDEAAATLVHAAAANADEQDRAEQEGEEEDETPAPPPRVPVRATHHVPAGRHKVLRQKDVARYSAADMAAILGGGGSGGVFGS